MTKPVRIQLSRKRGFNLQELSRATNGLPAVNVARPSKWGNPYKIGALDRRTGGKIDRDTAVERYLNLLMLGRLAVSENEVQCALRGKNLACWCPPPKPGEPDICHASVLLEIANA